MADKRKRRRSDYRPPGRPVQAGAREAGEAERPPRRRPPERPPAPWGRFPLVELCVLLGMGLLIAGFFVQRGPAPEVKNVSCRIAACPRTGRKDRAPLRRTQETP
jgi:hypothetical protein